MAALQIIIWILACIGALCVAAVVFFLIMLHRYNVDEEKKKQCPIQKDTDQVQ